MSIENLVGLNVTDPAEYQQYRDAMSPLLKQFGGSFGYDFEVSKVLRSKVDAPINRVFTIIFPDTGSMDAFFNDLNYLEVKNRHFSKSVSHTTIIATYQRDDI